MNEASSRFWTPAERAVWAPPEDITVSEWAARHRMLPKTSAIPGLWNNSLGPYAIGVMDSFVDPWVEQITLMASVQSMKSESAYNCLGFCISQDPGPALVVSPTVKVSKKVNRRLREMLLLSEDLSSHLTKDPDDLKFEGFQLDRMPVYFATAGSEADLQMVEARFLIMDEVDLYPPGAVKMAIDRTTSFWNRRIVKLSRPTVPEGHINQEYQRSDRRKFWVPCPHCGGYQVLSFWQVKHEGEERGKWPRDKRDPEYIKAHRVARYECLHCQAEIDDQHKAAMLQAGIWVPEGHSFNVATGEMPPIPAVSHIGYWWSCLYSPFKNFSEVAAEFFDTKNDPEKYRNFVTQWLAEPWKQIIETKEASAILQLRTRRPPLIVPEGTLGLTAGIDTQKRGFWVSIWAWTRGESGILDQHLIRYGWLRDEAELELWLFQDVYHDDSGKITYPIWRAGIDIGGGEGDSGSATLTEQVYEWLRRVGQGRVFGVKGAARHLAGGKKMSLSIIDKMPGRGRPIPGGIRIWILDTNRLKDAFWTRIAIGRVHLHTETGEDFAAHLAAEAKERDSRGREIWVQQGRKPNHLLDTAIYGTAMADPECWGGVLVLPPPVPADNPAPLQSGRNPFTGKSFGSFLSDIEKP